MADTLPSKYPGMSVSSGMNPSKYPGMAGITPSKYPNPVLPNADDPCSFVFSVNVSTRANVTRKTKKSKWPWQTIAKICSQPCSVFSIRSCRLGKDERTSNLTGIKGSPKLVVNYQSGIGATNARAITILEGIYRTRCSSCVIRSVFFFWVDQLELQSLPGRIVDLLLFWKGPRAMFLSSKKRNKFILPVRSS